MKRILLVLTMLIATSVWAEHIFKVCYHNLSDDTLYYINEGPSHKWNNRGELVGNGVLKAKEERCFGNITDETIFSSDYITFTVGKEHGDKVKTKWVGIANTAFTMPYVFVQDSTERTGGKLLDDTNDGKDNYELHIFVNNDGNIIFSNSSNLEDTDKIIKPRKFN